MKLSLRAFKEYVDFSGSAQDVASILADLGFPNDGIQLIGEGLDQVVVAKVLTKKKHPQADRLNLLTVSIGSEELPIVCGAQNMTEGDFVALAPVGSKVPGKDGSGIAIKEAKIRGETSKGMCCSEAELRLQEESEGIWLLPKDKISDKDLGKKVGDLIDAGDAVIDVDITPNRPDAMSIRGLAREFASKVGQKIKTAPILKTKFQSGAYPKIESFSDTYGFIACLVQGVSVKPSPENIQKFLALSGARSISNLVDITNQVLFELGHPIHFFDADKIDLNTLQARRAKDGETLELLNGKVIQLRTEDLVIADQNGPLSLAGIMGGAKSSVSESTKNIVIEVACFNAPVIRASAKFHQISSESSMRFERGLTAFKLDEVAERTLGLLKEVSGFDSFAGNKTLDPKLKMKEILWDRSRVEAKLGKISLSDNEIFEMLRRLEYEFIPKGSTVLVQFPWYRTDVNFLEDVMEDIARLLGYENLEKRSLRFESSVEVLKEVRNLETIEQKIAESLTHFGFSEILNLNFSARELEAQMGYSDKDTIQIENPLQSDRSILRGRLIPELVRKAKENFAHNEDEIRLFEMSTAFKRSGKSSYAESPVFEKRRLAIVWLPRSADKKRIWKRSADPYFEFKGMVESFFGKFKQTSKASLDLDSPQLHPKRFQKIAGGFFGELHPRVLKSLDITGPCFVGEWDLDFEERIHRYALPSQFPAIDLDASFLIAKKVEAADLLTCFKKVKVEFLEDIRVYDIFESKDLGADKKSLTFFMRYRSPERTLLLEEAKKSHDSLVSSALRQFADSQIALR